MKCRLCLEEKPLLKKSHIIPDFMYQELFDAEHRLYKVSLSDPLKYSKPPAGEYDRNILCAECDNTKIGQFEDYAAKVLYGGKLAVSEHPTFVNQVNPHGVKYTYCRDINYKKFKLFLLSILWRASVSKRELFSYVSLGPYEEIVRHMLYSRNPRELYDFPCIMIALRSDLPWTSQLTIHPTKIKENLCTIYRFLISGVMYLFYVGGKLKLPVPVLEGVISKSNEMKIFHVTKGMGEDLLKTYLGFNK